MLGTILLRVVHYSDLSEEGCGKKLSYIDLLNFNGTISSHQPLVHSNFKCVVHLQEMISGVKTYQNKILLAV